VKKARKISYCEISMELRQFLVLRGNFWPRMIGAGAVKRIQGHNVVARPRRERHFLEEG
jgi:hypothetical protein